MTTHDATADLSVALDSTETFTYTLAVDAALTVPVTTIGAVYPYLAPVVQPDGFVAISLRGSGSSMAVYRKEPSGERVELRGSPFALTAGDGLALDYEAPFDVPYTYVGVTTAEGEGESEPVVLPSYGRDWLRSLSNPERSTPVTVVEFQSKSLASRATLYQVLGRRTPVAVTDVMSAYTGQMTLYAEGSEVEQLVTLLADGSPLMFHTPPEHGEDRFYFVVTGAQWNRVGRLATTPGRHLTLDVAEVDASRLVLGVSPSQYDWDDVAGAYTDWDELVSTFPSWRDVLLAGLTLPGA